MFKTRRNTKFCVFILAVFSIAALQMAAPPPPDMWANTGAPGEATCVSCHNMYPLNLAGGYLKISTVPPMLNNHYLPGQNYTITETFSRPPLKSYQCSMEIIDSTGNNAGTMAITDSVSTYLLSANSGRLCLWAGCYDLDTLVQFSFSWTAPLSGKVSMYAAGVARSNAIGGAMGAVSTDSLINLEPGTLSSLPALPWEKTLQLYPNPAHNTLRIKTTGDEKLLRYTITNTNAQAVKTGNITNGIIDIADLPPGAYYLQCLTGTGKLQGVEFVKE